MDIMEIYVIIGKGYDKDRVVREIQEEGYNHNFFFGNEYDLKLKRKYMEICTEVWTFGNVESIIDIKLALDMGSDIWRMG